MQKTDPKEVPGSLKCPLHLVPPAGTQEAAWVHAYGNETYGPTSWRWARPKASVYVAGLKRHIDEYFWEGIDADADSKRHPLGHVIAGCNIVLDAIRLGVLEDDRPRVSQRRSPGQEERSFHKGARRWYYFRTPVITPLGAISGLELSPIVGEESLEVVYERPEISTPHVWGLYRIDAEGLSHHIWDFKSESAALALVRQIFGRFAADAMSQPGGAQ